MTIIECHSVISIFCSTLDHFNLKICIERTFICLGKVMGIWLPFLNLNQGTHLAPASMSVCVPVWSSALKISLIHKTFCTCPDEIVLFFKLLYWFQIDVWNHLEFMVRFFFHIIMGRIYICCHLENWKTCFNFCGCGWV